MTSRAQDLLAALGWAFTTAGRDPVSLETRAFGLRVDRAQPGRQLAWVEPVQGAGVVTCEVSLGNERI